MTPVLFASIELSLPAYCWNVIKNSSLTERLVCVAALTILILCTILIVYFTVLAKKTPDNVKDIAPHEWFLTRDDWLAQYYHNPDTTDEYAPLRLVVVQHTVSPECHLFITCAAELRNLQLYFINFLGYDIPYNFLIGNDGRVYEGRGWRIEGAHTRGVNRCSLGLGFIGDYREELQVHARITEAQVNRTQMLLEEGVRLGYLHPDYVVLGAKDLRSTESPGSNLYNELRTWPQYGINSNYMNLNCEEIYAKYNHTGNHTIEI